VQHSNIVNLGENVPLGLHPRATFSTSGSSYLNVALTTVHHIIIIVVIVLELSFCLCTYRVGHSVLSTR